jgi:hypothetical protein
MLARAPRNGLDETGRVESVARRCIMVLLSPLYGNNVASAAMDHTLAASASRLSTSGHTSAAAYQTLSKGHQWHNAAAGAHRQTGL